MGAGRGGGGQHATHSTQHTAHSTQGQGGLYVHAYTSRIRRAYVYTYMYMCIPVYTLRVYVYAYSCPCARVNAVSGPFFRERGRHIVRNIASSRLQHADVSTISRPHLLVVHSVCRLYSGTLVCAQCLQTTHSVYKLCKVSIDYTYTRIRVYIAHMYTSEDKGGDSWLCCSLQTHYHNVPCPQRHYPNTQRPHPKGLPEIRACRPRRRSRAFH